MEGGRDFKARDFPELGVKKNGHIKITFNLHLGLSMGFR